MSDNGLKIPPYDSLRWSLYKKTVEDVQMIKDESTGKWYPVLIFSGGVVVYATHERGFGCMATEWAERKFETFEVGPAKYTFKSA